MFFFSLNANKFVQIVIWDNLNTLLTSLLPPSPAGPVSLSAIFMSGAVQGVRLFMKRNLVSIVFPVVCFGAIAADYSHTRVRNSDVETHFATRCDMKSDVPIYCLELC